MEEEDSGIINHDNENASLFLQMGYKIQLMLHNNYNPEPKLDFSKCDTTGKSVHTGFDIQQDIYK